MREAERARGIALWARCLHGDRSWAGRDALRVRNVPGASDAVFPRAWFVAFSDLGMSCPSLSVLACGCRSILPLGCLLQGVVRHRCPTPLLCRRVPFSPFVDRLGGGHFCFCACPFPSLLPILPGFLFFLKMLLLLFFSTLVISFSFINPAFART